MIKLLIVDDEEQIRRGIKKYVQSLGFPIELIETAADGEEALRYSYTIEPDILITDVVMPGMDGIELAKQVREYNCNIKIIMISGYSDIEYMKHAFKFEAVDYILKPVDILELRSVLSKVIARIEEERRDRESKEIMRRKLGESMPLLREKFLFNFVSGGYSESRYVLERLEFLDIHILRQKSYVVIDFLVGNSVFTDKEQDRQEQIQLDTLGVYELLKRKGEKFPGFTVFNGHEHEIIIIISFHTQHLADGYNHFLTDFITDIQKDVYLQYGRSITAGIGNAAMDIMEIPESYRQSVEAVNQRFTLGKGNIIFYSDIHSQEELKFILPKDMQKELISCIYSGNISGANTVLDSIFLGLQNKIFKFTDRTIQVIKLELISFILRLTRDIDISIDNRFYLKNLDWNQVMQLDTLNEIKDWLEKTLMFVCESGMQARKSKSILIVDKAKEIITNCYKEPISVQYVADLLKISSNYLSALFKQETGVNFTEYMTQVRLSKARELMKDPSLKVYEICSMVGYEDQNYFARTFKKHFGISPSEFREMKE